MIIKKIYKNILKIESLTIGGLIMSKIYSAVKLPQSAQKIIKDEGIELLMHDKLDTPDKEDIIKNLKGADALISGVNVEITDEIIEKSKDLKMIANVGAGVNNIANKKASQKGILLSNTPSRNSIASTAEHALLLILAVSRKLLENQKIVKENSFSGRQVMGYLGGHQVSYKKLLIVGFGKIGQEIGRMAKAFNMEIYFYNHGDLSRFDKAKEEIGAKYINLEEGLKITDYVVLQVNYTKENYHLIAKEQLMLMKKSAYLINTSRGAVVDEKALVEALKKGKIAGAGLDVHEKEPNINSELIKMKQVVLSPHIGNDTIEARNEMAETAAKEAIRAIKGQDLQYQVK